MSSGGAGGRRRGKGGGREGGGVFNALWKYLFHTWLRALRNSPMALRFGALNGENRVKPQKNIFLQYDIARRSIVFSGKPVT